MKLQTIWVPVQTTVVQQFACYGLLIIYETFIFKVVKGGSANLRPVVNESTVIEIVLAQVVEGIGKLTSMPQPSKETRQACVEWISVNVHNLGLGKKEVDQTHVGEVPELLVDSSLSARRRLPDLGQIGSGKALQRFAWQAVNTLWVAAVRAGMRGEIGRNVVNPRQLTQATNCRMTREDLLNQR